MVGSLGEKMQGEILNRSKPMNRGTAQLARTGFTRKATTKAPAVRSTLKTKQRAVSADEKILWSRLAAMGCCACLIDGVFEPDVSIHHIDGRTKPGCHQLVLALCASHHQDGTGKNPHYLAVHPWKARFEARYGEQRELMAHMAQVLEILK
jgi:hypothetical protein